MATSTLELGIDVGDLDRVIEIDAPHTVASFLQRLGRSGRREGTRRYWLVKYVDWKRRRAYVEPSAQQGKSRWFGAGPPLHYEFCQAVLEVLAGTGPAVRLSRRAQSAIGDLRSDYAWADPQETTLVQDEKGVADHAVTYDITSNREHRRVDRARRGYGFRPRRGRF